MSQQPQVQHQDWWRRRRHSVSTSSIRNHSTHGSRVTKSEDAVSENDIRDESSLDAKDGVMNFEVDMENLLQVIRLEDIDADGGLTNSPFWMATLPSIVSAFTARSSGLWSMKITSKDVLMILFANVILQCLRTWKGSLSKRRNNLNGTILYYLRKTS